ncbi:hypothetical protein HK096_004834 [Nowakowskiella sp. JEL0078]|nr:hypothetical protein HK096_004834 [Nowakowskiella sp. JEL0078]
MQLIARRAESKDIAAIKKIIDHPVNGDEKELERILHRRYGDNVDIANLIDTSPFSLVITDAEDKYVLGFFVLSNGPPAIVDQEAMAQLISSPNKIEFVATSCGDWERYIKARFECKDLQIHNSKFVSFFVSTPENASQIIEIALSTSFNVLPQLKYICYLLPESLVLFPPFSSPKYIHPEFHDKHEDESHKKHHGHHKKKGSRGAKHNRRFKNKKLDEHGKYFSEAPSKSDSTPFCLYICPKKEVVSVMKIRKARVEDCDDLVPMLKRQNILQDKYGDFYLADLLESKNDASKTLVAEADGEVVGFMNLYRDIDQEVLANTFQLTHLDNLRKEDISANELISLPEDMVVINPFSSRRSTLTADPIKRKNSFATSYEDTDTRNPLSRPESQEKSGEQVIQNSTFVPPKEIIQPNTFCISLFCIEDMFANQAQEFIKAAFGLFPDRDYCVVTVPTTSPEIPLLRNFSLVQPQPNKDVGDKPMKIRKADKTDFGAIESLLHGLNNELETLTELKQIQSGSTKSS